ncbi:hypothetical protein HMN09_00210800 [Mycena chlorophos]|uniref:Glycosyltransferase family 18 catalytic domain-containing protein n=1 Tax=Mycena chlorophos TaxID=658473 RepID=A0A8H6TNU8_MYCCL|nr:hypothetical protein HMN09_00210800 [Mycena chlorophos]
MDSPPSGSRANARKDGYIFNPTLRIPGLLLLVLTLGILLGYQTNAYTHWAARLTPNLPRPDLSSYGADLTIPGGDGEGTKALKLATIAETLFPVNSPAEDRSIFAENERMLRRLLGCMQDGTCGRNQMKIVILASSPFRGLLNGDNGGEAIWANSAVIAMRNLGYSYLYTSTLAQAIALYQIFAALVPVLIVDGADSKHCFTDEDGHGGRLECVQKRDRPHGVPIWKMLSFHFWDGPEHPLGRKWTLNPEPYRPAPDNNTYLGYSVEPQCARQPFVPHSQRKPQAWVFAKNADYFDPERRAWAPEAFRRAVEVLSSEPSLNESTPQEGFRFLAGVRDKTLPDYWPPDVENGGFLPQAKFYTALAESRALVGMGRPVASPTPYDALCVGVPFINPILDWDRSNPDDRSRWSSQHNTLKHLDPPYVYNVFKGDEGGFVDAVRDAVRTPIESFVLPAMRMGAVEQRLGEILEMDWRGEAERVLEEGKKSGKGVEFWVG